MLSGSDGGLFHFGRPTSAMRKTPLALNTSDFWKLNDLIDTLYVIVDCHLRTKIKPSG